MSAIGFNARLPRIPLDELRRQADDPAHGAPLPADGIEGTDVGGAPSASPGIEGTDVGGAPSASPGIEGTDVGGSPASLRAWPMRP